MLYFYKTNCRNINPIKKLEQFDLGATTFEK